MKNIKNKKLLILGSGPAGYTASIYSSRANLNPTIITGLNIGGQLVNTYDIENWPGFYKKITGLELMNKFKDHVKKFKVEIINDTIKEVNFKSNPFYLIGENYNYRTKLLIIATGSKPKYLGLKSEKKFLGKGVSLCATCDAFFFKEKVVAVVGGGNCAIQEALFLSRIVKKIHLIHRRNIFKAESILIKKILKCKNIEIHMNHVVYDIIGNDFGVNEIKIYNVNNNKKKNIKISGIFIAIGYIPNTKIFKNHINLTDDGYIIVNNNNDKSGIFTQTNVPGIFAAGDVVDKIYKQAITASALGCMAALDCERFLNKNFYN